MKKVLFLAAANSVHTVKWVNSLCDKYIVYLVYCKNHKPDIDVINKKVNLYELKFNSPSGYYLNVLELKKIFKKVKPDIVNVHYASGYGTLARLARLSPILLSVWGSDIYSFPNESSFNRMVLRRNFNYAKEIASTSNVMADEIKRQFPFLKKKIYITPFGVDTDLFKKIDVKHDENINIGIVKNLKKIYGIEYGILAIKELKNRYNNKGKKNIADSIKFYIYGDGEEKNNLKELIDNNDLSNSIFLKGKIPNSEVPMAMNHLDVFCATSLNESFGVSLLEAMACELPIVATNVDGFKEVVDDGKTGYIVEKENVQKIADALEKLINNKSLSISMGKNGRKRVLKYYSWDKNVDNMCKIYDIIIKKYKK